jgi:methylthioribose-1-phosphate isomerase
VFETIRWEDDAVVLIDQRVLPTKEEYVRCGNAEAVAAAIRDMVVRGAPAIGVTAAMGIALGLRQSKAADTRALREDMESLSALLASKRPTAVNLFWAIERMKRKFEELLPRGLSEVRAGILKEALSIHREDVEMCRRMGAHGEKLLADGARILTHCNAGALATAGYGTALGMMRAAVEAGKRISVFSDETRPFLQGARLTAWELMKDGIPVTLITDNMAGYLMSKGEIDCAIVGADRIAANGDVANKIGTYGVAVLAKEHGIPFYVAAPLSTIDLNTPDGPHIPIEERNAREVTHVGANRLTPEGAHIRNPAFDVTPAKFVTAIITERGIARAPFQESLAALMNGVELAAGSRQ